MCCAIIAAASAGAAPVTLVEDGRAGATIVIPAGEKSPAAADLQRYIQKVSGAKLEIVAEDKLGERKDGASRVFVGPVRAAGRVVDLKKLQPEGFVIKTDGDDLFIVGRDTTETGMPVEGTFYGVCEFLERFLGVRWLMPGPLGEVTPKQGTIRVDSVEIRQEPLLWKRSIREVRTSGHADIIRRILAQWDVPIPEWEAAFSAANMNPWFAHQRLGERAQVQYRHSFGGWWDRYHEQYPDIFAQQPNGTRVNSNARERLCVSNPTLWDLVAQDRIAQMRENPHLMAASLAPNDGGGGNKFCSCDTCRSWDSPEARAMYRKNPSLNPGPGGAGPFPPLSDRYFRFFNEVAKRVKREMPDRYLISYAYSLYRSPPASIERLEDNLILLYVGPNSVANEQAWESARNDFLAWSRKASRLMLRPNMLNSPLGLPVNYVHRLGEEMRFFADHGMRLTDFASCFGNWGTHGLDYYVLARLLWDPYQEVDPIVDDYCRAAYGPGAAQVREYYRRLENLTNRIAATSRRSPDDNSLTDQFTDEALADLRAPLDQAVEAIGGGDPAAVGRVRMLLTGLDYTRQTRRLMRAAADVREGRASREQFAGVEAGVLAYYRTLALDWAVAVEQNYRRIRMGLSLNPAPRATAADADEP